MLWLYWFGKIFLNFFSSRQLGGIYIMGGISGALFFLLAYNIFPYFNTVADGSYLIGASASVMTIVFAASFYEKNYTINLLFIGNIKLIYLAFGAFILDFLAITSTNAGGHIAHIGGACLGILFAGQYRKGKDITNPVNRMIDKINNLFTKKPAFKVHRNNTKQKTTTKRRPETDREYLQRKSNENREIDIILDKLKKSGYSSLSDKEKQKLFDASKK
jgi:hypothetical protein